MRYLLSLPLLLAAACSPAPSAPVAASSPEPATPPSTTAMMPTALNTAHSPHSVQTTVNTLTDAFAEKGITVFTVIDHAAAAREAGLAMPDTRVIIFGNPKGGTPIMLEHPDVALDLPLRVLVRESAQGGSDVRWHSTAAIERNAGLRSDTLQNLQAMDQLIHQALNIN